MAYRQLLDLLEAGPACLRFLSKAEELLSTHLLSNPERIEQAIDRYANVRGCHFAHPGMACRRASQRVE